jgi:inward rectifier potassium channel
MLRRRTARPVDPKLGEMRDDPARRLHPIGDRGWHPSDLYHQLLRMSWPQLTLTFVALFMVFNLAFAAAYSRDPGGIEWIGSPVHAPPFWRAFFFSIQTVATIGYGNMYPVSVYANVLVVIEITLGILFFALVTGIVFARFSRPTARVRFSRVAAVSEIDGVPTLMFRAANLRHNLIFEAHATVSVLMDERIGGSVMRRFTDLKLVRDANPVFTLTWMIMHPIDESSPLARWVPGGEEPAHSEIVVVLSGFDDRTGHTIHGRWSYSPADIRWNARFGDILGQAADGSRTLDYRKFDDVEPVEAH